MIFFQNSRTASYGLCLNNGPFFACFHRWMSVHNIMKKLNISGGISEKTNSESGKNHCSVSRRRSLSREAV